MKIGLDVGSTTLKSVLLDEDGNILYAAYERHFSQISEKIAAMLSDISAKFPSLDRVQLCISGSAGMGIANDLHIPFVQEVYATRIAVNRLIPAADVIIERLQTSPQAVINMIEKIGAAVRIEELDPRYRTEEGFVQMLYLL